MKVTVLSGGPSAEREISLISGEAVAQGLRCAGHEVFVADISPGDLSALDHPADVVFPVLHGAFGESGELQEILEQRGIPFVGSGSSASRIGIDKIATKRVWERAGLPTPRYQLLRRATPKARGLQSVGLPVVLKPIDNGSSIDVFICRTQSEFEDAKQRLLAQYERVMLEQFIDGPELTIGLLEEEPLAPIRIVPRGGFYDYDAKYLPGGSEHHFELNLSFAVVERCRELARQANRAVGARDLARVDLMLDQEQRPWLLEINTMPGFTPTSLLPEAAAHAGIEFAPLVDRLITRAHERRLAAAPTRRSVVLLANEPASAV